MATGTLVAARPHGAESIDWEIVVSSRNLLELERAVYSVDLRTIDNRSLRGDALLVRSDRRAHVFRGASALDGITDTDLD